MATTRSTSQQAGKTGSKPRPALKLRLAQHPFGRVLLHLICLARDGKWRWHWAGVLRELRPMELRQVEG